MHPALNLILMTRDKDLRRWGRLSAVVLFCFGCFLLGAVFYSYNVVVHQLEPAIQSASVSEQRLVESIADENLQAAVSAGLESSRKGNSHLLDGARAVILGGGIAFAMISFYSAALSWRAYELASVIPESPNQNKQAADVDTSQQPC